MDAPQRGVSITTPLTAPPDHTVGSGNVFADLGLPEPEEALTKVALAHRIAELVAARGWTQPRAADALGIDQPKVSALLRGRLAGFSIERLLRFLTALDQDVAIVVGPAAPSGRAGRIAVTTAPPATGAGT